MEFDKSKVYTAVNADELKVGSKVIVAETLSDLKERVEDGYVQTLTGVCVDDCMCRFEADSICVYNLAYLVSEPEEKKLKWTDLKIGDVIRSKEANTITRMVTGIDTAENHEHIEIGGYWLKDSDIDKWEKVE